MVRACMYSVCFKLLQYSVLSEAVKSRKSCSVPSIFEIVAQEGLELCYEANIKNASSISKLYNF